ncbi:MAG: EndoU domain-containing protein [Anaerofustis sp.]
MGLSFENHKSEILQTENNDSLQENQLQSAQGDAKIKEKSELNTLPEINENEKLRLEKQIANAKTNDEIFQLIPQQYKDIFAPDHLEHILLGEIVRNKKGVEEAKGFHSESMPQPIGTIVQETLNPKNQNGIYRANVEIKGILKKDQSTFFPKEWSAFQVVEAIHEAYQNRKLVSGKKYRYIGETKKGLEILMYLDDNDKIITAYPR